MGADFRFLTTRLASPDYNCSAHEPDYWARLHGEQQLAMGAWSILIAVCSLAVYTPSIIVFSRDRKLNCVKIMRVLAIVDMLGIFFAGFLFGIQMFQGAVFCSHKAFILVDGMGALACWFSSSSLCIFLLINRILELTGKDQYFQGSRCSLVMAAAIVYGSVIVFFTPPTLTNSRLQVMLFCPVIPGFECSEYINYHHRFHNAAVSVAIPLLFLILYRLVSTLTTSIVHKSSSTKKLQAMIFTQGAIISGVNASGAIMWIAFNNFTMPQSFIAVSMIMYQLVHASPCLVYMIVNQSVRDEALKLLGIKKQANETGVMAFTVSTSTVHSVGVL